MGNKCCSKRPEPHIGSKKNDKFNSNLLGGKNDSLDSRYTPDPNRGTKILTGGGVDIIRPRNSKYYVKIPNKTRMKILFQVFVFIVSSYHKIKYSLKY